MIFFKALFGAISANGYQLVFNGNAAKLLTDIQITNIQVYHTFFVLFKKCFALK